jgi:type IV secretory pathway VirB10-like protein
MTMAPVLHRMLVMKTRFGILARTMTQFGTVLVLSAAFGVKAEAGVPGQTKTAKKPKKIIHISLAKIATSKNDSKPATPAQTVVKALDQASASEANAVETVKRTIASVPKLKEVETTIDESQLEPLPKALTKSVAKKSKKISSKKKRSSEYARGPANDSDSDNANANRAGSDMPEKKIRPAAMTEVQAFLDKMRDSTESTLAQEL